MPDRPFPGAVVSVTDSISQVEREITVLLRRTLEHLWARGYGEGPVDRYTYPVLVLLDSHGPMLLTELTARIGLSKPTVSRQVSRLGFASLVETWPAPHDPRAVVVRLTPEGARQVQLVGEARRESLRAVLVGWSDTDSDTLATLLARLNTDLAGHHGGDD
ncbi:MarR family winged helix-turn-helix transcriptional regulator [Pseudonocardia yunnanensis]|uniref:MarR family winged helix-turn-helix transcriptional regulator n=1 Tax=Pseudonocardia yunnanensis TaxID=58107 RepID=A0ABW4ENU8_9PSEU